MYGKIFASMFTGSMMGAGSHVHAVMTYAVSNADDKGYVELNPRLLVACIGDPIERMKDAIQFLCAPDPDSRTPDEDGRRLVREGQFLYRIVNYGKYRDIRNLEERRRQNREAKRRQRQREAEQHAVKSSADVINRQRASAMSAQAEAEVEVDNTPPTPPRGVTERSRNGRGSNERSQTTKVKKNGELSARFDRFWKTYPRKVAKQRALKIWVKIKPDEDLTDQIIASVEQHKLTLQWQRDGGQYIPHPATFLSAGCWEDEISDAEIRQPDTQYDRDGNILSAPCSDERLAELQRKGLFPSWPDEIPDSEKGNTP